MSSYDETKQFNFKLVGKIMTVKLSSYIYVILKTKQFRKINI